MESEATNIVVCDLCGAECALADSPYEEHGWVECGSNFHLCRECGIREWRI